MAKCLHFVREVDNFGLTFEEALKRWEPEINKAVEESGLAVPGINITFRPHSRDYDNESRQFDIHCHLWCREKEPRLSACASPRYLKYVVALCPTVDAESLNQLLAQHERTEFVAQQVHLWHRYELTALVLSHP